jgi:cytoskeletal protein RodZ
MSWFESKILTAEPSVAAKLKAARGSRGLEQAARELKIQRRYLEALEAGRFEALPAGVYAQSYLKEYARWLGLPAAKLSAQFARELKRAETGDVFERQVVDRHYFLVVPQLLRYLGLALIAVIFLGYIAWLIANIYRPPKLSILSPVDKTIVSESRLKVSGQTEAESEVLVNGLPVLVYEGGKFEAELDLKRGLNKITVVAQKKNKRKNVQIREVLYEKSE